MAVRAGLRKLDEHRTERTSVWTDPATGLQVRCVGIEYDDFPTVEWTVHFKNTGANDTPILSDIQAVDLALARSGRASSFSTITRAIIAARTAMSPSG